MNFRFIQIVTGDHIIKWMIGGHRETLSAGRGCENQALIQQTSIWTENACMVGYENRTIIDLKTENEYKTACVLDVDQTVSAKSQN